MHLNTPRALVARLILAVVLLCGLTPSYGAFPENSGSSVVTGELQLVQASRLNWPGNFQPSGLAWCRGRLLTVSDRHDEEIFELNKTAAGSYEVGLYQKLTDLPESPPQPIGINLLRQLALNFFGKQFDWEGISCDDQGNLYLASEAFSSFLKVPTKGQPSWIDLGHDPALKPRKVLGKFNAGIEGLEWLQDQEFLVAAEREPAGLIRCEVDGDHCRVTQLKIVSDMPLPPDMRTWDISDISVDSGLLYVLERYYSRVCRRDPQNFRIENCFSFKSTEKAPEHAHVGAVYGEAEGLVVKDDRIYVVLDSNGRPLKADPASTDTWLFEFKRPPGF